MKRPILALLWFCSTAAYGAHDTNVNLAKQYDYGAVCDFISARLYEVSEGIADDSGSHVSRLPTQSRKLLPEFRYHREGVFADFLISGSKKIITSAHFDAKAIYQSDRTKKHLLSRLGMRIDGEAKTLSVQCDSEILNMVFSGQDLTEVDISVNFID